MLFLDKTLFIFIHLLNRQWIHRISRVFKADEREDECRPRTGYERCIQGNTGPGRDKKCLRDF